MVPAYPANMSKHSILASAAVRPSHVALFLALFAATVMSTYAGPQSNRRLLAPMLAHSGPWSTDGQLVTVDGPIGSPCKPGCKLVDVKLSPMLECDDMLKSECSAHVSGTAQVADHVLSGQCTSSSVRMLQMAKSVSAADCPSLP